MVTSNNNDKYCNNPDISSSAITDYYNNCGYWYNYMTDESGVSKQFKKTGGNSFMICDKGDNHDE